MAGPANCEGGLNLPIRIYALAKELNIENKDLVEICSKAGITGKGSALASLTDEEVDKVKAYLNGGSKPAAKAKPGARAAAGAPTRAGAAAAITRDDYVATRAPGKIKVLEAKAKKPAAEAKPADESELQKPPPPKKEKEQVVRLAQIPEAKQPPAKPKSDEPKVQKPDIPLPKDAIAGARKGKTAPLDQFTQAHKQAAEKEKRSAKGGVGAGFDMPLGSKVAGKGRKRTRDEEEEGWPGSRMGNLREERTKRRKSRSVRSADGEDEATPTRERGRQQRQRGPRRNTAAPRKEKVVLLLPSTVRDFSEAAGVPAVKVCFSLASMQGTSPTSVNINTPVDEESARILAEEFGVEQIEFKQHESLEESLLASITEQEDSPESLKPRPPVVTFLGHVDHGKTSLLDRIIGINVVSGEAGGITQHIRAYEIKKDGRKISFVDTPGHAAFTEMRARGANVTDIAVLVVAADDGVMPQTEEAISHAKAAEVPIVVAVNKMDLPGANPDKVLQGLATHELLPSEWGGDVEVVRTSAMTGDGLDELLETILLTAEIHEYKANPNRKAVGVCLEAEQEPGRGVIAKVMVQNGTLHVGDVIVCGSAYGRVKAMYDTLKVRKKVKSAGPSTPVNITGFDIAPEAGESFYVLDDIAQAREIADAREHRARTQSLSGQTVKVSFDEFQRRLAEGRLGKMADEVVTLNLIIRADVRGSIEAIQKELGKFDHPEVQIKVLQASVGGITAADVTLADASDAVIVGFNVIPDEGARALADEREVEIRRYDIIYKLTDDIKAMVEGKLKPEERLVELGNAMVKEVFQISRSGTVAGCHVTSGSIERGCRVRVHREGRTIGDYALESLKRHKDDVKEVPRGMECGMKLAGFDDLKIGDVLEAYRIEEVARTL